MSVQVLLIWLYVRVGRLLWVSDLGIITCGNRRRGTVVSGGYSRRGHSFLCHIFGEGDICIWVGEIVWTVYVAVVNVKESTFGASVMLLKELVLTREQFGTACAFSTNSSWIIGSTKTTA